jgi:hypothetical protein
MSALGRREPSDWVHVERHPLTAAAPTAPVEVVFPVPSQWRSRYDQGSRNACVGYSSSWMLSLLNRHLYDPLWLWNRAKEVDEFPDTNPGDNQGTSVRAAMDVLRLQGAVRVVNGKDRPVDPQEGISANQWATRPDDVRTAIGTLRVPCVLGIPWYANFDSPVVWKGERWIGRAADLGPVRGGLALCVHGWSDKRQAARLVNSWGPSWQDVWLPAAVLGRLLGEGGECTMVVDRLHPAGEG